MILENYLDLLFESSILNKIPKNILIMVIASERKFNNKLNKKDHIILMSNWKNKLFYNDGPTRWIGNKKFEGSSILQDYTYDKDDDIEGPFPNIEYPNVILEMIKNKKPFRNVKCDHHPEIGNYGNSGFYSSFAYSNLSKVYIGVGDGIVKMIIKNHIIKPLIPFKEIIMSSSDNNPEADDFDLMVLK